MSYQLKVLRIEKVGPYVLPLTVKTYNPETLSDYDALASELCDRYADRKDIKVAGPNHITHKDWDEFAVLAGWLHPGQYVMYPCNDHMDDNDDPCWHVYDPAIVRGERRILSHVSYVEACKATGQECRDLEEGNREENEHNL
jgi:hypothetical protein